MRGWTTTRRRLLIRNVLVASFVYLLMGRFASAADKLRVAYVAPSVSLSHRETDPKVKSFALADFVDASFFREIETGGLIERLYRK